MNLFKNFKFKPRFVYFRSKIHPNQRTFCSKFQQNVIEAKMRNSSWESVVGLEVHAQIQTKSKLFSRAGTTFSAPVNSQVSVFDASLPGTLPVLNKACVEAAILTALALHSKINKVSMFDRKHYFYADLPLGYQITQQRLPLAYGGFLDFVVWNSSYSSPYKMKSKIHQIQLEQDSGKSLHDEESNCSLIDLNRAGIPLMEIVFEADLKNGEEAAALIEELQLLLRYIGTCDGKMDEGSLRVDANVSVNRPGNALGTRTEIKNLNSLRTLSRAIDFEIDRQIDVLEAGGVINNETRTFDTKSRETVPMRDKEMQQDYRFMPEPNLPPLRLQDELDEDLGLISINQLKLKLPKLPEQIREHITTKYELPVEIANILLREEGLLNFFESMVSVQYCDFKAAANFILNDLFAALYEKEMKISSCPVSPEIVGMLLDLKTKGVISEAIKDQVLRLLIDGDPRTPLQIIKDNKWEKITDTKEIEDICIAVLQENIHLVKKYKGGKIKIFNQLLGLVKKNSNTVDMKIANKILKEKIKML